MHTLVTTGRGAGHFGPLVPFLQSIVRAGGEVLVAVPRAGLPMVERAGFSAWPLPEAAKGARQAINDSIPALAVDEANARVLRDLFLRLDARAALPGVRAAVEAFRPHLVLHESTEFAGPLVAEQSGLPSVAVAITQASFAARFLPAMAEASGELRAELGLPPDPRGERIRREPCFSLLPEALEDPAVAPVWRVQRFRERPVAMRALPDWWPGDERPLVYLSFGSVAPGMPFFPGLYRSAIEALAGLDVRVLVTIGRERSPAELGRLPAGVRVEGWVPQADVLPHASAVVCHGGSGTLTGGLAAGVPLAVLPLFADQLHNARRVAALGAGVAVEGGPPAAGALTAAVGKLLEDGTYRAAARRTASEIAALPSVDAAPVVLRRLAAAAA